MIIAKNPTIEKFNEISAAIRANDGYCCCALERTPETKCICQEFRDQQLAGFCHCGRYYKINKYPIISLCGNVDQLTAKQLLKEGYIVIDNRNAPLEMRLAQIANSDAIYVVNYAPENEKTHQEIQWAINLNKKILSLKPIDWSQYEEWSDNNE